MKATIVGLQHLSVGDVIEPITSLIESDIIAYGLPLPEGLTASADLEFHLLEALIRAMLVADKQFGLYYCSTKIVMSCLKDDLIPELENLEGVPYIYVELSN